MPARVRTPSPALYFLVRKHESVNFDFDELLVNSTQLHLDAFDGVFEKYGVSAEKIPEELASSFIGKRLSDINKTVIDHYNLDVDPKEVDYERNKVFLDLVKERLELMPGAKEILALGSTKGFKLAVCSSGVKEYVTTALEKFDLLKIFDAIVTGDLVTKGKPDPECFLKAAELLKEDPANCIVFEDAENGVEAAKGAGMKVIAVRNPYTPVQDLTKADILLNSLTELKEEMLE